jgi:DNA helicase II / ATP-dependent DNA helicase PcrA
MPSNPHAEHLQELLEGLNEPQREAVTHGEGPLLILAGAGSGKTRVLTHRIAFLIYTDQAQAGEILAITFTNKAAQEMRGRVEQLLGRATRGMWVMTFHAACARILRAEAERLGYSRQFTIYDQADARRLTKRSADAVGVDPKRFTPAAIHNQISAAKNRLRAAADYRQAVASPFEEMVADVYEIYERDLHRMNAMDFDDLLFRTVNLLELFEEARTRYSSAFRHVLVDEYQDTNCAQYRLLQLLVGGGREEPARGARAQLPGHRNLAVVGDDSQSIYSFRGAEVRNILDFQDDFPDARVVKLEQNYRSTERILSAANAVIANNRGGIAKRLWSELGDGAPLHLRALDDEHAEARFVVGEIERLVDEGAARAEVAVLYRTNAMSRVIEDTLVRREIAYQVIGGTKFYERAEVKDAIAYLSLLANPFDVVSFTRVLNSPRRGLGQTSLSRIVGHAATLGISVWDAACAPEEIPGMGAAAVKALRRFMGTMRELRALAGVEPDSGARDVGGDRRGTPSVPVGDILGGAVADRVYRGVAGRAHDRGSGAHREPRAAGRGRARV